LRNVQNYFRLPAQADQAKVDLVDVVDEVDEQFKYAKSFIINYPLSIIN
jgi:hypothetical protein